MIYVGQRFTATVSGSIVKDVVCEKCGDRYLYQMTRAAKGEGNSPYYLNNAGATRRAEKRAVENLDRKLKDECDPVRCIACWWLQRHMVARIRRARLRWMIVLGVVVAFVGAVGIIIYMNVGEPAENKGMGVLLGAAIAAGVGLVLHRLHLNRNFDPNDPAHRDQWPDTGQAIRYADVQIAEQQAQAEGHLQSDRFSAGASHAPAPSGGGNGVPADQPDVWHYSIAGQAFGPVTGADLQRLAAEGRIGPDDLVWTPGMPQWTPAGQIAGLFSLTPAPA